MCEVYSDSLRYWERYRLAYHNTMKSMRRNDAEVLVVLAGVMIPIIIHAVTLIRFNKGYSTLFDGMMNNMLFILFAWWSLGFVVSAIWFVCKCIDAFFDIEETVYEISYVFVTGGFCALYLLLITVVPYIPFLLL